MHSTSIPYSRLRRAAALCLLAFASAISLRAADIPSPKDHFGFAIGDDYQLANFTQTEAYFKKLAATSDRVRYIDIGPTEEGRRQPMLIVSSPANLAKLDRLKAISAELALAENPDPARARALAAEGRAVVWIDGGLHATETVGTHQLIETAWLLATRDDPETLRILDEVVILLVHANPDGHELISDWYMRRPDPKTRVQDTAPRLYQKYIGHDNNRDFYISNMKETANMNRQFYIEWFPQIVYNHHQSAPPGTIVAGPPYRDPFNHVYDPLVITQLDALGAAMHSRWIAENMPGTTMRKGSVFSTWWNGGLRTTVYFHNMVGLLTETIGSPTPMQIPLIPSRQVPSGDLPKPVDPQTWHFRRSIEYSITANYAVLDYAARNRDRLLLNIHRMGRNSIERGSRDNWTRRPARVAAMKTAADAAMKTKTDTFAAPVPGAISPEYFDTVLRAPGLRDPRGYILTADPAEQHDRAAVAKFINALSLTGITIHKATAPFAVAGKNYPAGSYVIKTAQAFRPHIIDMFEPQDHPLDFLYEGGPPIAPYDSAGWTLAFQMGIAFDRVLDDFTAPLERLPHGQLVTPLPGSIAGAPASGKSPVAGYLVSHRPNQSFTLANRLIKAGAPVFWLRGDPSDEKIPPGTLYIPASPASSPIVTRAVAELGLDATALASPLPTARALKLAPARIALWDRYGGSMPSGWTRWLLEQYEYDFDVVYARDIDDPEKNLRDRYDVIIFVTDAIPAPKNDAAASRRASYTMKYDPKAADVPAEYRRLMGAMTEEKTIPALRRFLEQGGSIVAIGTSTRLAAHLELPVRNALLETLPDGAQRPLPREKYYIPGSVLRAHFDPSVPLAWGMTGTSSVYFNNSPVFMLAPEALARGVRPVAWFGRSDILQSGWAWGERHISDGLQALEAPFGAGKIYLLAPEVAFRAQPHATFKLLFNPLHLATATSE